MGPEEEMALVWPRKRTSKVNIQGSTWSREEEGPGRREARVKDVSRPPVSDVGGGIDSHSSFCGEAWEQINCSHKRIRHTSLPEEVAQVNLDINYSHR